MASLSETNPYLRDKKKLLEMLADSTYESSILEGASPHSLSELKPKRIRRRTASSRKAPKSEQSPA